MGRPAREHKDGKFICGMCKEFLPASSFHPSKNCKAGIRWACKACSSEEQKQRLRNTKEQRAQATAERRQFLASEAGKAYLERTKNEPWQQKRKYRALQSRLQPYGLSIEEFADLMEMQNYACACCFKPFETTEDANVDHCHRQGHVRGLLCSGCNMALGFAKDDVMRMLALAAYIAESEVRPDPEYRRTFDLHARFADALFDHMASETCERPDRVVRAEYAERRAATAEWEKRS